MRNKRHLDARPKKQKSNKTLEHLAHIFDCAAEDEAASKRYSKEKLKQIARELRGEK